MVSHYNFNLHFPNDQLGFPEGSVKNPSASAGHGFDPCVGMISWKRKWQPPPVPPPFLPGESHGQRSLAGLHRVVRVTKSRTCLSGQTTTMTSYTEHLFMYCTCHAYIFLVKSLFKCLICVFFYLCFSCY